MPLLVLFGRYGIEGILGPGGVTETYLARPCTSAADAAPVDASSLFALKLLRPDRIPEKLHAEARRRFVDAALKLRDFRRPGFAKVLEVSDDPSATFLVTEFVAGADLVRFVEQQRASQGAASAAVFDPALVGAIGAQIARLLHVGHVAKPMLCHLGLAPQNVIVGESGDMTLVDAGIACVLRGITEQPPERWAFVAPELHNVDLGAVVLDERRRIAADLYSLGAILHFLLTGEAPPSQGQAPRSDLAAVAGPLSAPLQSLLSPEPHERPESAQRVVEWLAANDARDRRERIAVGFQALRASLPPVTATVPGEAAGIALPSNAALPPKGARRRALAIAASLTFALGTAGTLFMGAKSTSPRPGTHPSNATRAAQVAGAAANEEEDPSWESGDSQGGAAALSASVLSHVAGHLVVETVPPGADVYVDGVLKGQTFADIVVGAGGHHVVAVSPGYRMLRETVDTTAGAIIRRTMAPAEVPAQGNGLLNVECRSGRLPILVDERETGLLCPAKLIPIAQGKHLVGVFVPAEARAVSVEATVEAGAKPAVVHFVQ